MLTFIENINVFGRIKAGSIFLYCFLLLSSVGIAFVTTHFGIKTGFILIICALGIPALGYMLVNLRFGVIALIFLAFFLSRIGNFYITFPLGTIIDTFILILLIGLVIKKSRRGDYSLAKGSISYIVWGWLIYNGLQFFNPMQTSETWIFAIRSMAGHTMFYFIVLETIKDLKAFKQIVFVWIGLAFLGAVYGLFQEFHGLLQIEKDWLMSNPRKLNLYTYHGKYRIFSFFNDPTVFGILMSFTCLFCLFMLNLKELKLPIKIFLALSAGIMLLTVVYTGTRTAYAMIPAGFGVFALITFQKRTIIFTGLFLLVGAGIIFSDIQSIGPFIGKGALNRIRSAFNPSEDASFLVRLRNQAIIKPFIQTHPIGAGIGTLGTVGKRFNPDATLTGFDADSMYVKVAVELGWIGLIMYCALLGMVLILAIRSYFRMRNPELKIYMAAIFAVLFSIVIANYTQMVTIQLPTVFIFYTLIAGVVKLKEFDENLQKNI